MRDIPNPPQLEDVAYKILKEFGIDTMWLKIDPVEFLKRKFELITDNRKRALLIFDNADDLIEPPKDKSCKSSTFSELSRHIRGNSRETIRAVFTTRVYNNTATEEEHYTVKLQHLSKKESEEYLQQELKDKTGLDKEQMVRDITDACHGLPFVLRLVCSYVNKRQSIEMIKDFISDLKKSPSDSVCKDHMQVDNIRLSACFDLSLKRLDKSELELLSVLAVFPGRFSYTYVKKLLSCVGKDGSTYAGELLAKFEEHSLIEDDSHADEVTQDERVSEQYYAMHFFFCQHIKKNYWDDDKEHCYKASYYKLYTNALFVLGGRSLEKDNYKNCWIEFRREQHNFDYVMTQIGKLCDQDDCPSHVREAVYEMIKQDSPDFIAMCLFCIEVISPSLLLKFVKSCEKFADDSQKKKVWCCHYDLYMKYFDSGVEDPYRDLEADNYGKALLDKWSLSSVIQDLSPGTWYRRDFEQMKNDLKEFKDRVDTLERVALKNYFNFHILKLKGRLLKKCLNMKELNVKTDDCIKVYDDAMNVCTECFGDSLMTFDCYNQRGKLFWQFEDKERAITEFDKAFEIAESMKLRNSRRFGSYLLDKGRVLVDLGTEEQREEGRKLLEDVICRCNEYSDTKYWCQAMGFLLTVDKSRVKEVKERFFQTEKLNSSLVEVMERVIKLDIESIDEIFEEEKLSQSEKATKVVDLVEAIKKLDAYLKEMQNVSNSKDIEEHAKTRLFVWQMWAALRCTNVMDLSERKVYAERALEIMNGCPSIHCGKKEELLAVVNQECDAKV